MPSLSKDTPFWEKAIEWIVGGTLTLVGIVGFVVSLRDSSTVGVLLGLLSIAIGLERLIRFRRTELRLDAIDISIQRLQHTVQHLSTKEQLIRAGEKLSVTIDSHLRIYVHGRTRSPQEWTDAGRKRIEQVLRTKNRKIIVSAAIVLDPDNPQDDILEIIEQRRKEYVRAGAEMRLRIIALNKPTFGIDLFILDSNHLIIGLSSLSDASILENGLLIEDQKTIVDDFVKWFDDRVFFNGVNWDEYLQRINKNYILT